MRTIRGAVYLLLALCLADPADAQELLSPKAFVDAYIQELRARAPGHKVKEVGSLHLAVESPESDEFQVFLDNAYTNYRNSPESMTEIIADHVAAMLGSFPDVSGVAVTSRIVPVIKDAAYIRDIRQSMQERGQDVDAWVAPAHEPYNEHLIILYAEDTDMNVRYLREQDLEDAGISATGRREKAVENLRALLPPVEAHGENGTYMLTAGGTYESSLVLIDDIWQSGQLTVNGELVVAVPARDLLLVTGSKDRAGLEYLRRTASDVIQSGAYWLTDRLFVYRDGRFVPFGD